MASALITVYCPSAGTGDMVLISGYSRKHVIKHSQYQNITSTRREFELLKAHLIDVGSCGRLVIENNHGLEATHIMLFVAAYFPLITIYHGETGRVGFYVTKALVENNTLTRAKLALRILELMTK